MPFNSFDFAIFLPIVFFAYWFLSFKNRWLQNFVLLAASYVFYGFWDWRFLGLIFGSSVLDYIISRVLVTRKENSSKKWLLGVSITANLGLLGFFKYYNFFVESFQDAFSLMGTKLDSWTMEIILPVGISFYTFQTISYTIDVYKGKIIPTRELSSFLVYVSFFPQLVAGPIERATNLLPQFLTSRSFDFVAARSGVQQILWGLFKKIVIADNCARWANEIFSDYGSFTSWDLVSGAMFFSFQIYGDFSGYSDIAIGTAKLFGINLKKNFSFPYFSRDIAEFWRRWHISLTTWFRDYLYIPLGGNRVSINKQIRNVLIVFLVSGFWHGANWTFIAWGAFNALLFIPILLFKLNRRHLDPIKYNGIGNGFKEFGFILFTYFLVINGWVLFRSDTIADAGHYIARMYDRLAHWEFNSTFGNDILIFIGIMIAFEWFNRKKDFGLDLPNINWLLPVRWIIYIGIIALIYFYTGERQVFLYFQF
jgi:alginate O-acetyltransferase complex protein AlgI